jgi:hypothetical protein
VLEGALYGMTITSHTTSDDVIRAIHIVEEAGGDLNETETYWLSRPHQQILVWHMNNPDDLEIVSVREVVLYLLGKGRDAWSLFFKLWRRLWRMPNLGTKDLLDVLLDTGLDPNFLAGIYSRPLLILALCGVSVRKDQDEEDDEEDNEEERWTQDDDILRGIPIWCLVELLIRRGADIFYMHLHGGVENWWNIVTPTECAIRLKVEEEWRAALRACGYDPDQVYEEDKRRRIDFIKLCGAKRTGIDVEELSSPSGLGLRQRKPYQS